MTQWERVRAVSWDVDGTLYSLPAMRWHLTTQLMREIARGRGRAAIRDLSRLSQQAALVERSRASDGKLESGVAEVCLEERRLEAEQRLLGAAIARAGLRRGVSDFLDRLAAHNLPMIAISDYTVDYKLKALGISHHVSSVVEGVRLGYIKPSPRLFVEGAAKLGIPASAMLHIGDREDTDGVGARAAGCQVRIVGPNDQSFRDLAAEISSVPSHGRA